MPGGGALVSTSQANADACFKRRKANSMFLKAHFKGLNECKQTNDFQAIGSVALHSVRQHIQRQRRRAFHFSRYVVSLSQFWDMALLNDRSFTGECGCQEDECSFQ